MDYPAIIFSLLSYFRFMNSIESLQEKYENLIVELIPDYNQRLLEGEKKKHLEQFYVSKLIQKLGFKNEIDHHDNGQPFLINHPDLFVSISHSNGYVALVVAAHPIGIDIETPHPKIQQGSDYFLNSNEQIFRENLEHLHLIWGAKEAIYKLKSGLITDLRDEVSITKIDSKKIYASLNNAIYECDYVSGKDFTLVVVQE